MKYPISPIQSQVCDDIIKGWKTNPKQVLAWYTGSGKTNVFLEIARRLLEKNPKLKIGVSTYLHTNIKRQTVDRAKIFLKSYSSIESYKPIPENSQVIFFNPQALFFRESSVKFDYLFFDEAHIGGGEESSYFTKILDEHCKPNVKLLGVTATPWNILEEYIFKGSMVHSRGLDKGLHEDKRISDFKINIERFDIETKESDYSRNDELTHSFMKKNFDEFTSNCVKMVKKLISNRKDKLGSKCLIIVPGGQNCEIAKRVADSIGKSAIYLIGGENVSGWKYAQENEDSKILEFKTNPKIKFLCVVNKCQIGFDMPELTSTIDMTMSRNIGLLIQRWGRLARKTEHNIIKEYFYCIDNKLSTDLAEWIISKSVQYASCDWDISETKNRIKFTKSPVFGVYGNSNSISFSAMVNMRANINMYNHKTIVFSEETRAAGFWTCDKLANEAKKYKDRTELSAQNRYVYNLLKKHHNELLNEIFPIKNDIGKWNLEKVLNVARKCHNRSELKQKYGGAFGWAVTNGHLEDIDKILPNKNPPRWNKENAINAAMLYDSISEFKLRHSGAYDFLYKKGFKNELKMIYINKRKLK